MTAAIPTYAVAIDWDQDGDFGDAGEDVTARVRAQQGIVIKRGRDQIRAFAPPVAGALDFTLDNTSRDYSPQNAAGPLYGLLAPGPRVQVTATHVVSAIYNDPDYVYDEPIGYEGTSVHYLGTTFIDDLVVHPERSSRSVDIPCLGALATLAATTISTVLFTNSSFNLRAAYEDAFHVYNDPNINYAGGALSLTTLTTDVLIGYLLDAVGWPTADRVINPGMTVYECWWLDNENALAAAVALLAGEGPGAALYEDGQGRIVFEGRDYRTFTPRCTTSQRTISDTGGAPEFSEPFDYRPNLRSIVNEASATYKHRTADASGLQAIWAAGYQLILNPNEVFPLTVQMTTGDYFSGALVPVLGTDYSVPVGSVASMTLDRTSGTSATLTVIAGGPGATINSLQVRAYPRLAAIWTLGTNLVLTADQTKTFQVRTSSGDPFGNAIVPVAGTDYTVSAGSLASITLDRISGGSATLAITAGAGGATLTGLQVRAYPVPVSGTSSIVNSVDASASITARGLRAMPLGARAEIVPAYLQDVVDAVVTRYKDPRTTVEITLNNASHVRLAQALGREISDRITIVETQTGLNTAFFVEHIEHRIEAAGLRHVTVLGCEAV